MLVEPDGTPVIAQSSASTLPAGVSLVRVRRWNGVRWITLGAYPAPLPRLARDGCGPLYGVSDAPVGTAAQELDRQVDRLEPRRRAAFGQRHAQRRERRHFQQPANRPAMQEAGAALDLFGKVERQQRGAGFDPVDPDAQA